MRGNEKKLTILIIAMMLMTMGSIRLLVSGSQLAGQGNDLSIENNSIANLRTANGPGAVFIENQGQVENEDIHYYCDLPGMKIGFGIDGLTILEFVPSSSNDNTGNILKFDRLDQTEQVKNKRSVKQINIDFNKGNHISPVGRFETSWKNNFFRGNDLGSRITDVSSYDEVFYENTWDGIDIVYRIQGSALKYDIIAHPYSDIGSIKFEVHGNGLLKDLDQKGIILSSYDEFNLVDEGLEVFYSEDIDEAIDARIKVNGNEYSFDLKDPDRSRTIVIDPLIYSTYIGSSGWEEGWDIAVDDLGNSYITRSTNSPSFPITDGAYDDLYNGGDWDIFVCKLSADGTTLEYSTYIGGSGHDNGVGISIDPEGYAYITGGTDSTDFPTTRGAFNETRAGTDLNCFVVKLGPNGDTLEYSTFIGGDRNDVGDSLKVDDDGFAYVTGMTASNDFPVSAGSYDTVFNGGTTDAFVLKLDPTGSTLSFSSFLGGGGDDHTYDLDIDNNECVYVFGETSSSTFPTTEEAYDKTYNGGSLDLFVTKINHSGEKLDYSTFIGGSEKEQSQGIVVDDVGFAYITGATSSTNFPVTLSAYDRFHNGHRDIFLTKIGISGGGLIFSTYIGGNFDDVGFGIDVDQMGYSYIVGITGSSNYPTTDPTYMRTHNGGTIDTIVSKVNRDGSSLRYSTYFGGSGEDFGVGIVCDENSCVIFNGFTASTDIPTTEGSYDTTYNGGQYDHFVAKINLSTRPSAPRYLTGNFSDQTIDIEWREPAELGGPSEVSYRVYRGPTPAGIEYLTSVDVTRFNDNGLVNGEKYYYRVSCENDLGEGGMSNEIWFIPGTIPSAPRNVSAIPFSRQIEISWDVPTENGGYHLGGYYVYGGEDQEDLQKLDTVYVGHVYLHTGLINGRTYYYEISAYNDLGEGSRSERVEGIPAKISEAPLDLYIFSGDSFVNLSWDEPIDNGGADILGYNIYRGSSSDDLELAFIVGLVNTLVDDNVSNGARYVYRVHAFNSVGEGEGSNEVSGIPSTIPESPLNVSLVYQNDEIRIDWIEPEDGGLEITAYTIYRAIGNGTLEILASPGPVTTYSDTEIQKGNIYYYQIGAVNGNGEGHTCPIVSITPATVPGAPVDFSISNTTTTVTLSWNEPIDNGGFDILEYNIYKRDENGSMSLLTTVKTGNSYTDPEIIIPGTYFYQVSAVNVFGEGINSTTRSIEFELIEEPTIEDKESSNGKIIIIVIIVLVTILLIAAISIVLFLKFRKKPEIEEKPLFQDVLNETL